MEVKRKPIEFYSTQSVNRNDKKSVIDALSSDFLSRGPIIQAFERKLGKWCDNEWVVVVNSGTSALQLAYQVSGIKKDSLVWTTPLTFAATANAAVALGAEIDFVDIDPETLNLCPVLLEEKLKEAKKKSKLPDCLTVVHFAGNPCEMEKFFSLSRHYKFKIIEDASHALGAYYKESPIGSNEYSDISIFSFHPVKMITTGEGGALLLSSKNEFELADSLRSHGMVTPSSTAATKKPMWYYEQQYLGNNYRMSEIQAALGLSQMKRLGEFVKKRNELADIYSMSLEKMPIKTQTILKNNKSSYHLYTIEILDRKFSRDDLYLYLKKNGIGCQVHYIPVHMHPFYKRKGFKKGRFKNSEAYFEKCLSVPLHQGLKKKDVLEVCSKLEQFFSKKRDL